MRSLVSFMLSMIPRCSKYGKRSWSKPGRLLRAPMASAVAPGPCRRTGSCPAVPVVIILRSRLAELAYEFHSRQVLLGVDLGGFHLVVSQYGLGQVESVGP